MLDNLYSKHEIAMLSYYFNTYDKTEVLQHLEGKSFEQLMSIFAECRNLEDIIPFDHLYTQNTQSEDQPMLNYIED